MGVLLGSAVATVATVATAAEPAALERSGGAAMLRLTDGGEVTLDGIVVPPRLDPGARARLAALAAEADVTLQASGVDRHGRAMVRALGAGGDLADRLVAEGLAYAAPGAAAEQLRRRLALEAQARDERRGLWADPELALQDARRVRAEPARFAVVDGRISRTGAGDRWIYLNFGDDRRVDFTVRFAAAQAASFRRAGLDAKKLEGRRVRARGWLSSQDGPMIELSTPLQIEVIE